MSGETAQAEALTKPRNNTRRPLPDGWRWVRLGEVCTIVMGQSPAGTSYNSEAIGVPLLNGPTEFGSISPTPVQWTTEPTKLAEPGDILLCVRGATTGRKNIADREYCIGRGLAAIRGKSALATTKFIMLCLDIVTFSLLKEATGSTFPNLPGDKLEAFEISLPPIAEQERIAAHLSEQMAIVDEARSTVEAQLAEAAKLPAAYLRQVFEGDEAQAWPRVRLGELISEGPSNGAFKRREEFGKGVPFVNVSDLYRSLLLDLQKTERVVATPDEVQRYGIKSGDLFFCRSSLKREGVGWCCYIQDVSEPAIFDSHVMRVHLDPSIATPEYIAHYWSLPSVREWVIGNAKTGTMTTINQGDLLSVEIISPSIEQQSKVATQLTQKMRSIDELRASLEEELAEINKLPAMLLRRAFNGEI